MAVSQFQYRKDGGPWIDAGPDLNQDVWGLTGTHAFEVRAVDEHGVPSGASLPAVMTIGTQGLQDADGAWLTDADGAYLKDAD